MSKGRTSDHRCASAAEVMSNQDQCYYQEHCRYKYWPITDRHPEVFPRERIAAHAECPFKGGMNQLWRNMLLALALEQDDRQPYAHASFSVVKHPENTHLEDTLTEFKQLTGDNPRFSVFASDDVLRAAAALRDDAIDEWVRWYRDLYLP